MTKTLVLLLILNTGAVAQTPERPQESETADLIDRVVRPLIFSDNGRCVSDGDERLPFYYGGSTPITLSPELRRCLAVIPRDSFPSRNPFRDGYRGRILTLNRFEVSDSIVRVSATYSVIRGAFPQFWNYSRGSFVEYRKRSGKWVETDRVEGVS